MPACAARRDGKLVRKCPRQTAGAVGDDVADQRAERREREQQHEQRDDLERDVDEPPPAAADGRDVERSVAAHAYSSRNRSRSQALTRFRPNVPRNSSMPTAKIVRYSSVPCGVSPRLTCTM